MRLERKTETGVGVGQWGLVIARKLENENQVVKEDVKEDEDYLRRSRRLGLKGQGQVKMGHEKKTDLTANRFQGEELALIREELL